MGIDIESQETLDEVEGRVARDLKNDEATLLGEVGRNVAALLVGLRNERTALQDFIGGLRISIEIKFVPKEAKP